MNCGSAGNFSATTPIAWDAQLAQAAAAHTLDMAQHQTMSHTGSDGSSPGDRITRTGYTWSTYGENVAYGYATQSATIDGWRGSDGHCANMMNPQFTEIGMACVRDSVTNTPYWTLVLAKPR